VLSVSIGLPLMFVAVVLLFAARNPTNRYLDAFAIAYKRLPKGREWITKVDRNPKIERLRRIAVALRFGAFLVFLVGAVISAFRLQ
jgi:hypothetical protein